MGCGSSHSKSALKKEEQMNPEPQPEVVEIIEDATLPVFEQKQESEEEDQTNLKITEIYFRRKTEDIAVVSFENEKQHLYPFALMRVYIQETWYTSHILSYSPNTVKILLPKKLQDGSELPLKVDDVVQVEIIRHENPINIPIAGIFVIGHGFSLPLLIQIIKIYKLKPEKCEFMTLCHRQDDLIFKSSLRELVTPKSIELQNTVECLDSLLQYYRKQIQRKEYNFVLAVGPPWLLKFIKRLSQEVGLKKVQFYGLENLYGSNQLAEPSSHWADLRESSLEQLVKFDPDEVEYEILVENYIENNWNEPKIESTEDLQVEELVVKLPPGELCDELKEAELQENHNSDGFQ